MTTNSKQETLRRAVVELLELEETLERTLGAWAAKAGVSAEVSEALRRFVGVAGEHRTALDAYLASTGGSAGDGAGLAAGSTGVLGHQGEPGTSPAAALAEAYGALNAAAFRYSVLTTMAFRLYEPPLRELAPKHLRDYAAAAQAINQLIAPSVASELGEWGLECQCTCPMCTFGACGCVAVSTRQTNAAWRETAPAEGAGLLLQPPRMGSDLARAGVCGGELLLAVDDRPIRDFTEVQAAIREHAQGDEMRLRLQRGGEEPAEVRVSRISASLT